MDGGADDDGAKQVSVFDIERIGQIGQRQARAPGHGLFCGCLAGSKTCPSR